MSFPRATGILLHPTSLPSRGGIGDFGPAAYEFVDFLAAGAPGLVAGAAAGSARQREFSLFFHFRLCRQSAVDQPGTAGGARLD